MSKVYIAEYAGTAYTPQGDTAIQLAAPTVAEQKLDTATTTGAIAVLGALVGGAAYVNGQYNNVPLTGGTGSGATANITVAGGAVTVLTLVNRGQGYTAADSLSASNTNLGGAGAGMTQAVTSISIVSAPFNAATRFVEISVDGITGIAIGGAPTVAQGATPPVNQAAITPIASVSTTRLNINERIQRGVQPGATMTIITTT